MAGITFSKSSNVNDSVFGKSQEPIFMFIEKKAEAFEQMSLLPKLFKTVNSKNFAEKFTEMTAMNGFLPVGEGGSYPQDEMQEGFSKILEPDTWKDQFVITQEMVEDGKVLSGERPAAFISGYNRTRELFGAKLFISAIMGTPMMLNGRPFDPTTADGQYAFSVAHPSVTDRSRVQSNKFSNAFSAESLAAMETAMQNFVDDKGNPLNVAPDTIVIPNDGQLKQQVFAVLGADKDPNTANNGANFLFGRWNIIVSPYLNPLIHSDGGGEVHKPWMLLDSQYNNDYGGAILLERLKLGIKSWIDNNNDNNVWNGRSRYSGGFKDWRAFCVGGTVGGTSLEG